MNAAFCCASLGIVPTVRHADYIGSWLEVLREDNRAIVRAADGMRDALSDLLQAETRYAPVVDARGVIAGDGDRDGDVARACGEDEIAKDYHWIRL